MQSRSASQSDYARADIERNGLLFNDDKLVVVHERASEACCFVYFYRKSLSFTSLSHLEINKSASRRGCDERKAREA